jgi:hypothetical protein
MDKYFHPVFFILFDLHVVPSCVSKNKRITIVCKFTLVQGSP